MDGFDDFFFQQKNIVNCNGPIFFYPSALLPLI